MKVRASVKPICEKCKVIRRGGAVLARSAPTPLATEAGLIVARIAGSTSSTRVEVGLLYVQRIGRSTANEIVIKAGIDLDTQVKDLTEEEVMKLREAVEAEEVEGDLRRERSQNIKRLQEIGLPRSGTGADCRFVGSAPRPTRAGPQGPAPMSIAGRKKRP